MNAIIFGAVVGLIALAIGLRLQIANVEHANERQARELAILLCSHHWQANGVVTHEHAAAFRDCMAAFDRTGRVP